METTPGAPAPPLLRPYTPWATRITLGVVATVSLLALYSPFALFDHLLDHLRKDNDAIRNGEWWRLITPGLVHGSATHLAMNGIFLADLGGLVERLFGPGRMLLVLWGSVVTGTLASYVVNPSPSVGISGGLFGLVGALLAQGLRHWRRLSPEGRKLFLRGPIEIVLLNLALGFALPSIDNAAHLGGLAGGLVIGVLAGFPPDVRALLGAPPPPAGVRGDL